MRPKRISRDGGEYVKFEDNWYDLYLPNNSSYWHIYQIGQLHPDFLGLFPVQNEWVSLTDVCNKMGMIAELYTTKGVLLPKFETYYMVTGAKNLIIATRKQEKLLGVNYDEEDVWFRVYTNAYFQSARSNHIADSIVTKGYSPRLPAEIIQIQTEFESWRAKTIGFTYAIINGYYYEEISPFTCKVGDLVEWVYDGSVAKVVEFPIDKLPNFDSVLDDERKYLLHYAGKTNRIDYQDDIDIFLVERVTGKKPNGLYHHKNTAAALRMVTHKDYAMSVQLINSFVDGHPTWIDPQKLMVRLVIRNSGWDRPLEFENNRIHELYKLKEKDFLPAMIGDNAAVPSWQAATLENANYPLLMRSQRLEVTLAMVQAAYGYNACSKILGDTPRIPYMDNGTRSIDVPMGLYENSTMYEYDSGGVLIGWYPHPIGGQYIPHNNNCALVEGIRGFVAQQIDEVYDQKVQNLDPKLNYRMYTCDKIGGIQQNNWRDVTGTGVYAVIDDVLTWMVNMTNTTTLVRSDMNAFGYVVNVPVKDGLMEFDLIKYQLRGTQMTSAKFDVPMGELDLILNGRSILEKIDYVVKGSKIIVFNKKYLINPETQTQQIAVRFSGFCKSDLTREKIEDLGFVKWEVLSRNAYFNLRDDRVMRIVVDGRVRHRSTLKFSESNGLTTVPNALNGEPYGIRDIVVPMRSMTDGDTYSFREASRVIDKQVSDYMSTKLPEPTPTAPNVIEELYPVYSPFLCKIMFDLINGVIDTNLIKDSYDANLVRSICAPYEYILEFDPTQVDNHYNPDYMSVHPHYSQYVLEVDIYHFTFLQRVVDIYMKDKVVLNHWLRLKPI